MFLFMILLGVMFNFSIEREYFFVIIKYFCLYYGLGMLVGILVYFLLFVFDDMIKIILFIMWLLLVGVVIILYLI